MRRNDAQSAETAAKWARRCGTDGTTAAEKAASRGRTGGLGRQPLQLALLGQPAQRPALERLDANARQVIELRFGIGGAEPLTLREVAQRMGLSAEGVRKLERRALRRLAEERELQGLAA